MKFAWILSTFTELTCTKKGVCFGNPSQQQG